MRIIYLATFLILLGSNQFFGQASQQDCLIKYNLFKGDYQSKKYDEAYTNWIYLMDNCPTLSVSIYQYGENLTEKLYAKAKDGEKEKAAALVKRVYTQRLEHYPDKNPAKVHNDYVSFLIKNKLGSKEEVYSLLEKTYKTDPSQMGVRNIYIYFQEVVDRNKDSNPQVVFDTYDDMLEVVASKLEYYAKNLKPLLAKQERGEELDRREKNKLRAYTINSKNLGKVEGGLDAKIVELSTCERLIPLYNRDFDAKKSDAKWLKRAVSRMYNKECTDDPLFEKIAKAYADAEPSADAYYFVARVLEKNGDKNGSEEMMSKAYELETDPLKKANFKLKFAENARKKGQKSRARSLAREAIQLNPNLGKAYLFIANLYGSSVNDCGNSEFEKRMTYVAAYNMARRAAAVDPSISDTASKFLKNYKSNFPSKKVIFTEGVKEGDAFTVKCWINETVKVAISDQ